MPALAAPRVVISVTAAEFSANFTGDYNAEKTYQVGQWVSSEEGLWACTQPVSEGQEQAPEAGSEFWKLIGSLAE